MKTEETGDRGCTVVASLGYSLTIIYHCIVQLISLLQFIVQASWLAQSPLSKKILGLNPAGASGCTSFLPQSKTCRLGELNLNCRKCTCKLVCLFFSQCYPVIDW